MVEALTLPGFGDEPLPSDMTTLDDVVDWLTNTLEKRAAKGPVILCGHSYGGRLAVLLASRQALPIKKLILVGSPNLYRPTVLTKLKKLLVRCAQPIEPLLPEALKARLRAEDFKRVRGTALAELYKNVFADDQAGQLQQCPQPTLMVCGDRDEAVSVATAREIANLLPHGELEIISRGGHNLHHESPQLLAGIIHRYATDS